MNGNITESTEPAPPAYYETRLHDALTEVQQVDVYLDSVTPEYQKAVAYRQRLIEIIANAMQMLGNRRKFVGSGAYAEYQKIGKSQAVVNEPNECRKELEALGGILQADLDAALPIVKKEPTVEKAAMTAFRKLANYGDEYAAIINRYLVEGKDKVALVVRTIEKNITPKP